MLKVTQEKKPRHVVLRLSGTIDESSQFSPIEAGSSKEVHVFCGEIKRLNSEGIKSWIKYFEELTARGMKLRFFECSTAVVHQINLIVNFLAGGEVESIHIPFCCSNCKRAFSGLCTKDNFATITQNMPRPKCPHCGGVGEFDDVELEYFSFLNR